jgi:hypothetical protein
VWYSKGSSALIDSCKTGMSASGNAWTSTDQAPWSIPQLSRSSPSRWLHDVGDLAGQVGIAWRGILHGEEHVGEAVEVVNRLGSGHRRQRRKIHVQMRGDDEDRSRFGTVRPRARQASV